MTINVEQAAKQTELAILQAKLGAKASEVALTLMPLDKQLGLELAYALGAAHGLGIAIENFSPILRAKSPPPVEGAKDPNGTGVSGGAEP